MAPSVRGKGVYMLLLMLLVLLGLVVIISRATPDQPRPLI
jgi:hypothetical protein